jgi:aerobic carbon-monoxide dehydrogenase large subunit
MSILGNRVVRREDPKFLTAGGTYVDDVPLEGAVWVTYVRSTMAHARIRSIDTSEAAAGPGVLAVFTAADVDLAPMAPSMPFINQAMTHPWLATGKVRFVGEPVAAVVTEQRYQGPDAAERVSVDYDPLPVVVDAEDAVGSATHLFEDVGSNVACDISAMVGFTDEPGFFDGCEVVVHGRFVNQRLAPCPLEVRSAAAAWDGDHLTQWASTQAPNSLRDGLAGVYGLDPAQVRVIAPDVGGGFGAKAGLYTEEGLLGWIARRVGRPVRWTETRTESMLTLGHGRGQIQYVELGGNRDGKVLAYRNRMVQDAGAYPAIAAFLPMLGRMMATGVYDIPKAVAGGAATVTNTTPLVAYRGAGRPEAAAAIERAMDMFATEIGMDPAEVRRRNMVAKESFPYTTATGTQYDTGDYHRALELVLEGAGYDELRRQQAARRQSGDRYQMGIGLAVYVEITNPLPGGEFGSVEITTDGKARIRAGTFSHGQGHATTFAMIVADRLGIPLEDIEFIQGDTDQVPTGQGTMGSRSLQTGGAAVAEASTQVIDRARQLAADLLEASP